MPIRTTIVFASLLASGAACSDPPEPVFAADWATSYQEVRDCRRSGDHDLNYIRVLVDPQSAATYADRAAPFPEGAVVLKPEYRDPDCTDLARFTVMKKEAAGFDADRGDWFWQETTAAREVTQEGTLERCIRCHALCGQSPTGHDWTCAEP